MITLKRAKEISTYCDKILKRSPGKPYKQLVKEVSAEYKSFSAEPGGKVIIEMICKGDMKWDMLELMLKHKEQLNNGEISQSEAEKQIGEIAAKHYLKSFTKK